MMKKTTKFIALLSGAALLSTSSALAGTSEPVATDPVGYTTVTIPAGSIGSPSIGILSFPLYGTADVSGVGSGAVTAATANTVTIASAGWTPNTLGVDGNPFFLQINTGALEGSTFLIEDNTADSLTLKTNGLDISGLDGTDDSAAIIPGDTVMSVFGGPSEGVIGGTGSSDADILYVLDGSTWLVLFYSAANDQWERVGLPGLGAQGDIVISPSSSVMYQRVGPQLSIVTTGAVPVDQVQLPTDAGSISALATVIPVDTALGDLGIETLSNWRSVGDAGVVEATADLVYLLNGGVWTACYYNASSSEWLRPGLPGLGDQSSLVIASGGGYITSRFGTPGVEVFTLSTPY